MKTLCEILTICSCFNIFYISLSLCSHGSDYSNIVALLGGIDLYINGGQN